VKKETECGLFTIQTDNEKIDTLQKENLKLILYIQKLVEIGDEETVIILNKEIYQNAIKLARYFDSLGLKIIAKAHYISACDFAMEGELLKKIEKINYDDGSTHRFVRSRSGTIGVVRYEMEKNIPKTFEF